jgi:hypothetical protein
MHVLSVVVSLLPMAVTVLVLLMMLSETFISVMLISGTHSIVQWAESDDLMQRRASCV